MKTYGDSKYKGFIIAHDNNNPKVKTKHYIEAVDYHKPSKTYSIYVATKNDGQYRFTKYKRGSNKNVDIAINTWHKERIKHKMRGIQSLDFDPFE